MKNEELARLLKSAGELLDSQSDHIDAYQEYRRTHGALPGTNVFDFVLADARRYRELREMLKVAASKYESCR